LNRHGAVPAGILHLDAEIGESLLAYLETVHQFVAVAHFAPPAFVQTVLGLDERAVILEQPVHAVVGAPAFLVGGERDDQVARGLPRFALIANQIGEPDGGLRLVVARAAAVEESALLVELEGIHGPVGAAGLYPRQGGGRQERTPGARAAVADDHIHLVWGGAQDLDVPEAFGLHPLGDPFDGGGGFAGRVAGVEFNELFEDFAGEALVFGRRQVFGRADGGEE